MTPARIDTHVSTSYSTGHDSILACARSAQSRGLTEIGFADRVNRDTPWLAEYVLDIERVRELVLIDVVCGVEVEIVDTYGTLDMPVLPVGVQRVIATLNRVPTPWGPMHPANVRGALTVGHLTRDEVVGFVVEATCAAMRKHPGVQLSRLFAILPEVGIAEDSVSTSDLHAIAATASVTDCSIEVHDRGTYPSARMLEAARAFEVQLVPASGARAAGSIGRH